MRDQHLHGDLLFCSCQIFNCRGNFYGGRIFCHRWCCDLHAVCRNVDPSADQQVDVPVNSASRIPPGIFLGCVVCNYFDFIFLTIFQIFVQNYIEIGISV